MTLRRQHPCVLRAEAPGSPKLLPRSWVVHPLVQEGVQEPVHGVMSQAADRASPERQCLANPGQDKVVPPTRSAYGSAPLGLRGGNHRIVCGALPGCTPHPLPPTYPPGEETHSPSAPFGTGTWFTLSPWPDGSVGDGSEPWTWPRPSAGEESARRRSHLWESRGKSCRSWGPDHPVWGFHPLSRSGPGRLSAESRYNRHDAQASLGTHPLAVCACLRVPLPGRGHQLVCGFKDHLPVGRLHRREEQGHRDPADEPCHHAARPQMVPGTAGMSRHHQKIRPSFRHRRGEVVHHLIAADLDVCSSSRAARAACEAKSRTAPVAWGRSTPACHGWQAGCVLQ